MIKWTSFFKRAPSLGVDAFLSRLAGPHADTVRALPGLRAYVQNRCLPGGYRKGEPVYDAAEEWSFDSFTALREALQSAQHSALVSDRALLGDTWTHGAIVTEDVVIKDGPRTDTGVKSIEFVVRKPDMLLQDFHKHWIGVHGPLGAAIPTLDRYVQSHTLHAHYHARHAPAYDGLALTWWADTAAMRASASSSEYAKTRADEGNFLSGKLPVMLGTEHPML